MLQKQEIYFLAGRRCADTKYLDGVNQLQDRFLHQVAEKNRPYNPFVCLLRRPL